MSTISLFFAAALLAYFTGELSLDTNFFELMRSLSDDMFAPLYPFYLNKREIGGDDDFFPYAAIGDVGMSFFALL